MTRATREVLERNNIVLGKKHDWREPKEREFGEINGLPGIRGKVVLTNGIMCLLETANGEVLEGHYEWFVKEKPASEARRGKSARKSPILSILQEIS